MDTTTESGCMSARPDTQILSDEEVEEIQAKRWVYSYDDERADSLPCNQRGVVLTVGQRDALCHAVRALRAGARARNILLLELGGRGELLAKEHVNPDALDGLVAVRNEFDRLRNLLIPNLESQLATAEQERDRFATLADERHDLLSAERHANDNLRADNAHRTVELENESREMQKWNNRANQLAIEGQELRRRLTEAHTWIDRKNTAIETWQQEAKENATRLAQVEQEGNNLRADITHLNERLGIQEGHCKRLQEELTRAVRGWK